MGVSVERENGIATVVLDRPERRNAFDSAMAGAFDAALAEVAASDDAVVVLRGAGPVFCAGWDLRELAALRGTERAALHALFARNLRMLRAFAGLPQPTIVAAHGAVAGFGFSLLARADIAIAASDTRLALPEIAHGIVPAMVMLDLVDLPHRKAGLEWLLSGSPFSPADACAAGLLTRVVEPAVLDAEVGVLARTLAGHDRAALAATKRSFQQLRGLRADEAEQEAIDAAVEALSGTPA